MAEFVFRDLVKKAGILDKVNIASSATSREEIGNPVHYGTREKLSKLGISTKGKVAVQLKKEDYFKYDYIIGMENMNIRDIFRIIGTDTENKVYKLLDFAGGGDIDDPWYTGNFDRTYKDILLGCEALLEKIEGEI